MIPGCDCSPGSTCWQTARKPNFVLDDHSSRRRITAPLQQPTRKFRHFTLPLGASGRCALIARKKAIELPAYLVLLRVGFTMRFELPQTRCALTAPFHPYPAAFATGRYILCCTGRPGAFTSTRPGRYPAHCPAEFGLSSPGKRSCERSRQRSSSRLLVQVYRMELNPAGLRISIGKAQVRLGLDGRHGTERSAEARDPIFVGE